MISGLCTTNDGSSITIGGEKTTPGSSAPGPAPDDAPRSPSEPSPPPRCAPAGPEDAPSCDLSDSRDGLSVPAVTIGDLARFAPEGTRAHIEPGNVGVAGLPANFVAHTRSHTVHATLFGSPLDVRFTPAAHVFDYGDGTVVARSGGGATWATLGLPPFSPTDTSHVYAERGTYQARVDVRYTADVSFGDGWFRVPGHVTSRGAPQGIRVYEAHTALVAHTCHQTPHSPGC